MKIIDTRKIKGTNFTGGKSYRAILERDNMGFALMRTEVNKGGPYHWHYKNHLEACYCVKGVGLVRSLETGEEYRVLPGIAYALDKHDSHTFEALTDVTLVSVFNPPLTGSETHDANGNYDVSFVPLSKEAFQIAKEILAFTNIYDAAEYIQSLITKKIIHV